MDDITIALTVWFAIFAVLVILAFAGLNLLARWMRCRWEREFEEKIEEIKEKDSKGM